VVLKRDTKWGFSYPTGQHVGQESLKPEGIIIN